MNVLEYKGYHAKIEYDAESNVLFGQIEGIRDLVNFESNSSKEIDLEFHNAVDDYLIFCEDVGKTPDKEYKGLFNVRIDPELHRRLSICSFKTGESINSIVEKSIEQYLNNTFSKTAATSGECSGSDEETTISKIVKYTSHKSKHKVKM